jgi:two-component system, sensor histidine kinase and response regulator
VIQETHVLTIDDDKGILAAYESILSPRKKNSLEDALMQLEMLHDETVSDVESDENLIDFTLNQATSGLEGVAKLQKLHDNGISVPVCIVDMRMPNGIDGLETSLRLKLIDPHVHIIIATAYSDRSEKEILSCLKSNIYYVRKPFNSEEIYQLVYSLSISYEATKTINMLNSDLENRVEEEIEKNRQKDSLLLHQAKLAAMGEMIGNIAHQWRQPLNVISMLFQKINRQYKHGTLSDDIVDSMLVQAMDTISHMSQTIDDFRGYFEPNKEKKEYSLTQVIQQSISLVESSFSLYNIDIKTAVKDEITLCGYPEDLKQVLMNLLNNSKDAIKGNEVVEGMVEFHVEKIDEKNALILFQDNGGGIPSDYIEKIFEPYFTTKHKSQGTGIGLYMSKRIVEERIEGSISVSNNELGACFKIIIPIINSAEGQSCKTL